MTLKIKLFFPLFTFFFLAANAQNKIDVLHYRFNIELNDENDSIYGKAEITVQFLSPANTVEFDLAGSADGKGMVAFKATGDNVRGISRQPEKISLYLLSETKTGDTATYTIFYKGIPADGLIISKNKYGHRTFFADNWPNRGHNWIPCHDDPADKASVEFVVTAPRHYKVVANGIQTGETNLDNNKKLTRWKEDIPISTKVMVIGVADFAVNLSGYVNDSIPVYSWVYPEDSLKGFYDYAQANEILPFYTRQIGPYGYKKLANVQSKTVFGGMENANTIFYTETSVTGTRSAESLLAHEIAHQWFGNMATEKTFAHLWLSEGFATYMTILYFENKYGADTATKMLMDDRQLVIDYSKTNNHAVVDNTTNYLGLLNPNSYQKGSWVLHMLHRQLGDSVFWKSIRKYYATYAGKTAGTDDLEKIFEEVSGKDLKQFFRQWLFTTGQPKLNLTWKYLPRTKKITITVKQVQDGPAFQFPLEIGMVNVNGKLNKEKIDIQKTITTLQLPVKNKPASIEIDPETSLLFEGAATEFR